MIHRKSSVRSRDLEDGELALMDADDTIMILLNGVGAAVWELCATEQTVDSLTSKLCEHFSDVAPASVRADVDSFVVRLTELGVVWDD
jgi:hypothetical protein